MSHRVRFFLATLALSLGAHSGGANQPVATFQFADAASARSTWKAQSTSPPVRSVPAGTLFSCPFNHASDRFWWDAEISVNLRGSTSLELDITPVNSAACRTFSLYLKSGTGWYHWSKPIRGTGRQSVRLVQSEFSEEGSPLGWHRITGIRISPWKGKDGQASFIVHRLVTHSDRILLVQASTSAANTSDRLMSRLTAQRVGRFLDGMNIHYGTTDDDGVVAGALSHAKFALLCYTPNPKRPVLRALRSFINRGGKLIVIYSSSEELAQLMGLRMGPFTTSHVPGRWATLLFHEASHYSIPKQVHDIAWNLIPVYPASPSSKIIAYWGDASGSTSQDPACVAGPAGFWFIHLLRGEDLYGKERMLLGLIGYHLFGLWANAARYRMRTAGSLASHASLSESFDWLQENAPHHRKPEINFLLHRVRDHHYSMSESFAAQKYTEAILHSDALEQAVLQSYGLIQHPEQDQFRAIWDHDGVGLYPGNWLRTCQELSEAGIKQIFPNLLWSGKAHFPSQVVPISKTQKIYGDQAEQCIRAARTTGMQVHVWKVCWNVENAPADFVRKLQRKGRLQQDAQGTHRNWLCPSHPENRRLELAAILELATTYRVDGIHLDYLRYPSSGFCFCPTSRRAFEKSLGFTIEKWPQSAQVGGSLGKRFQDWRANEITTHVRDIRKALRQLNRSIQLSAAVYRSYPSCREGVGQDWGQWLREDLIDFVCPMTYSQDLSNFRSETMAHMSLPRAGHRIVPGIGVSTSVSQLTPDQVIDQIRVCRELGTQGFILFDLSLTMRDRLLPILKLGTTTSNSVQ